MPPEILAFISQNPVCTLATSEEGQPHVRANPNVELCYLSQDFSKMLRIRATMKAVDDRRVKQQLIDTRDYLAHFAADDPAFMLLSPVDGDAWFWTLADNLDEDAIERVPFQREG
jgi:uncharacterized pyridoxamine 5'-phosphate oxidase family protein